jgi:hypothetical protein
MTHERERDRLHRHPEVNDDHRGQHLPGELQERGQVEAVVQCAHEGDHRSTDDHPVPQFTAFPAVAGRQPDQDRNEHSGEDREATEQRRRSF